MEIDLGKAGIWSREPHPVTHARRLTSARRLARAQHRIRDKIVICLACVNSRRFTHSSSKVSYMFRAVHDHPGRSWLWSVRVIQPR